MQLPTSKLRSALADGRLREGLLYVAAYLLYGASRWAVTGDRASALDHARWIVELEATLGVAVEASVQRALEGTALMWLLNHVYVLAQVAVVPAALIWLYRRDGVAYRRLRPTRLDARARACLGADDLSRRRRHRQPLRLRHRRRRRDHPLGLRRRALGGPASGSRACPPGGAARGAACAGDRS
jgi:hypothetical protein